MCLRLPQSAAIGKPGGQAQENPGLAYTAGVQGARAQTVPGADTVCLRSTADNQPGFAAREKISKSMKVNLWQSFLANSACLFSEVLPSAERLVWRGEDDALGVGNV